MGSVSSHCCHCPASRARYKAGNPNARPQSLAKRKAFESNSQAGEELLQLPPFRRLSAPLGRSRSHICVGPSRADSNAIHLPFGETAETAGSAGTDIASCVTVLVDGSNSIMVEVRFATSSK